MTPFDLQEITADTTKVTADNTRNVQVDGIKDRLRALMPPWFADKAPKLDGLLTGVSALLALTRGLIGYAKRQTRVATSTGGFLDLTAYDFFRNRIQRRSGERDFAYQMRIRREVFRPRATRAAIIAAVEDLTGTAPAAFEAFNPGDCGGYGVGTFAYAGPLSLPANISGYGDAFGGYGVGGFAYVVPGPILGGSGGAGAYGSLLLPNQIFLDVRRPAAVYSTQVGGGGYGVGAFAYGGGRDGRPALSGYGGPLGGYGAGQASYGIPDPPYEAFTGAGFYGAAIRQASVSDAEIYATIAEATPAGVTAWTRIRGR